MVDNSKNVTERLDCDLRYPQKGDRLLRSTSDRTEGVRFSQDKTARHIFMGDGYMRAAEALIAVAEQNPVDKHTLIYPILFNYRQAVELEMKWVIKMYGRHAGVDTTGIEHHNLLTLWRHCKATILKLGSDEEGVQNVELVIKDFHDLDKYALAFRYSETKNGILISLPDKDIDLQNTLDVMRGIKMFFIGVDGMLDNATSSMPWC